MQKYIIKNITTNYENETEVYLTRDGRKYLLVTNTVNEDLSDGYDLYIEGDCEGEWLKLAEESAEIDLYFFNEAIKSYWKQEELGKEPDYVY